MGEGAYGATRESDMREPGSKCVIPILFAGDGLKCVDVHGNLTFGDIEMSAEPRTELLDYVLKEYRIRRLLRDECVVVNVPFTGQFEATRGDILARIRGPEPIV